nr:tannase/feruloyl esterase family alpha/beta hydrolase [Novosphingobium flavum]
MGFLLLSTVSVLATAQNPNQAQSPEHVQIPRDQDTSPRNWLDLPIVKPVIDCERLASVALGAGEVSQATINSAKLVNSAQGPFCKVTGNIGPGTVQYQVFLPVERWTQRFALSAQNILTIPRAITNEPALKGQLVLAITDRGGPGITRETPWTYDNQQKRIDWSYRANHVTSLAAKALIKAFYGQSQRFSYFIGCSNGGREALSSAQRYPSDFDGISAGAPVVIDSVHNAFFPGWEWEANRRSDGSVILASSRLKILHDAVMQNCAPSAGLIGGLLQTPSACTFKPAWVQCSAAASDTAKCLTSEEARVAEKLYRGPQDDKGRLLDLGGFPPGSELYWKLSTSAGPANVATNPGRALVRILSPSDPGITPAVMEHSFHFDQEWFGKVARMAPLWNTANTNLRPLQKRDGKLILWIGAADLTVQPTSVVAYYEGVQRELGAQRTDSFTRLFLLPGVGHCGGGEGPGQVDLLSPLMAWTELHRAPEKLIVGKTAGGTASEDRADPYSQPAAKTLFTRPVFPYPQWAQYAGTGDPNDEKNYINNRNSSHHYYKYTTEISKFFSPDNQHFYQVKNGRLVVEQ